MLSVGLRPSLLPRSCKAPPRYCRCRAAVLPEGMLGCPSDGDADEPRWRVADPRRLAAALEPSIEPSIDPRRLAAALPEAGLELRGAAADTLLEFGADLPLLVHGCTRVGDASNPPSNPPSNFPSNLPSNLPLFEAACGGVLCGLLLGSDCSLLKGTGGRDDGRGSGVAWREVSSAALDA